MALSINAAQGIQSTSTDGIGYGTGAGGSITQQTSKATGVVLNKICGQITTNNAILNAGVIVSFVVTCTPCAATDNIILNHVSGGTPGSYLLNARPAAGSFTIDIRNTTAGNLTEALVIGYTIVKSVIA